MILVSNDTDTLLRVKCFHMWRAKGYEDYKKGKQTMFELYAGS